MAITLPHDAMAQVLDAQPSNHLPAVPHYNICPTTQVHVVTAGRRLRPMRWGFIPTWYDTSSGGPLLINARSETIAAKPAFRDAVRTRRCLIVASGFYEWKRVPGQVPQPWYVTRADGFGSMAAEFVRQRPFIARGAIGSFKPVRFHTGLDINAVG